MALSGLQQPSALRYFSFFLHWTTVQNSRCGRSSAVQRKNDEIVQSGDCQCIAAMQKIVAFFSFSTISSPVATSFRHPISFCCLLCLWVARLGKKKDAKRPLKNKKTVSLAGMFNTPLPSVLQALGQLVVIVVVEEVMFYYSHRLLHHRSIYKYVHKLVGCAAQTVAQLLIRIGSITNGPRHWHGPASTLTRLSI